MALSRFKGKNISVLSTKNDLEIFTQKHSIVVALFPRYDHGNLCSLHTLIRGRQNYLALAMLALHGLIGPIETNERVTIGPNETDDSRASRGCRASMPFPLGNSDNNCHYLVTNGRSSI